jgi:hypothetical protein
MTPVQCGATQAKGEDTNGSSFLAQNRTANGPGLYFVRRHSSFVATIYTLFRPSAAILFDIIQPIVV